MIAPPRRSLLPTRTSWAFFVLVIGSSPCALQAQAPAAQKTFPTVFDLPYAPAGSPPPAKAPQDLQGTWVGVRSVTAPLTVEGQPVPYNATAQRMLDQQGRGANANQDKATCAARNDNTIAIEISQENDRIALKQQTGGARTIWLNEKKRDDSVPITTGHSVGHWEGNTLVVKSAGFTDAGLLDYSGGPHGEKLKTIERIRKVTLDGPSPDLQVLTTFEDPDYYTKPWTLLRTYRWRPDYSAGAHGCGEDGKADAKN